MRREVKFRGRRINGDEWVYGFPHVIDTVGEGYTGRGIQTQSNNNRPFSYQIDKETLSEFTGLKDKNGMEIYEGDILAFEEDKFLWLVEYDLCCFVANGGEFNQKEELIEFYDWKNEKLDIVIVGNIYEHPHLLEVSS
ncbi:YopX family protein [Psychrobacillus sp. FSL K6-4615]|uniref:YopX family protein n=1 Tax=Psychrobacillus sp. FSL K6-4615 TaxID=2921551 RepID=UPI0030FAB0B5